MNPMNRLVTLLLLFVAGVFLRAADLDLTGLFQSDEFRRRFAASYGFDAAIEPTVSLKEQKLLEELAGILKTNLSAAELRLASAVTTDSSAALDFTLGNFRFQQSAFGLAAGHYRAALRKFPDFRRAHKNLALVEFQSGNHANALQSLLKSVELGDVDAVTFGLIGHCHLLNNRPASAESAYRRALMFAPENENWKQGLASTLIAQGRHTEAAAWLEELLQLRPERADLWLAQADAFLGRDETDRAAANYELLRRIGSASTGSLLNLADIYVNRGLATNAVNAYLEALARTPPPDSIRILRAAEVILNQGNQAEAARLIAAIEKTAAATPDEARAPLLRLKSRIALTSGDRQQAVQILESLLEHAPTDGRTLILLGNLYAAAGDGERAALLYERAARVDGFAAEAMVRQAVLLVGRNQFDKAVVLLRNAQAVDPRPNVADYLERLERLAKAARLSR